MTELKPCPFCGGDHMYLCAHYDCYAEHYGVFCNDCKTWFSNENYEEDEDGTRNWWNTRALPIPDTPEMVRALDDAYEAGRKSAERTCKNLYKHADSPRFWCSECDFKSNWPISNGRSARPNHCPNCGAKVVGD